MILDLVARLRAEGRVSIIMIAHNYVHVLEACDRVNLIQDGEITFDKATADTSVEELNEIVVDEYRRARLAAVGQDDGPVMSCVVPSAPAVPPTGSQFLLEAEGAARGGDRGRRDAAVLAGGRARSSSTRSRSTSSAADFRGKVLVPWPNRIRDAPLRRSGGTEHRAGDLRAGARQRAARARAVGELVRRSATRATRSRSGYMLHPQPGYPFTLELEVAYRLDRRRARGRARAPTNLGADPAPFGAGFHPAIALAGDGRRGSSCRRARACRSTSDCCRPAPRCARGGQRRRLPPPAPARRARAGHVLRRPRARSRRDSARPPGDGRGRTGGDPVDGRAVPLHPRLHDATPASRSSR